MNPLERGPECTNGDVGLRIIRRTDGKAWREVRDANHAWLSPWEGTSPTGPLPKQTFGTTYRRLRAAYAAGGMFPFVITFEDRLVGQLTLGNIIRGSLQGAYIGYWIDHRVAGRNIMPTAVALALDYGLGEAGLHRIEISIRPENAASLRVVEKLHLEREGLRRRYLHIDGDWRDHEIFVVDSETRPALGFTERWNRERTH